jgi:methylmalonyl-CoA mutase, N-terminal domain
LALARVVLRWVASIRAVARRIAVDPQFTAISAQRRSGPALFLFAQFLPAPFLPALVLSALLASMKKSPSHIPIPPVVRPLHPATDYAADLNDPGVFPFTRGIQPDMYRGRLWTMRQYAGFGTAAETNARFRLLLEAGQTGLSVAFDLPTQMGIDSDSPRAQGEVGRVGVAIDTVDDMHALLADLPLDRVSTSMTINATASILLAMYIVVAEERGIARETLSGTIQNDILKEYVARGTYIFPPEPSLALIAETFRFCAAEVPNWNPISISGYHMREAGATAVQELAFTFANAVEYVRRAVAAGLDVNAFAPRLSFFFAAHNDLFEEVAKFRAARRLYARLMRERFGADDRSCRLRFHTQTGGVTLQAQQPLNNVVRVAIQALSAVLGGTQSLHTNGYDEALALPTEDAATLALRTQQIIAYESGAALTADPLAGSYHVERLTNELEDRAAALLARVDELGGAARAIDERFFQEEIARSAYEYQLSVEHGETVVVGVNRYGDDEAPPVIPTPDFSELARGQVARLEQARAARDAAAVAGTLAALRASARGYVAGAGAANRPPLVPLIIDAVRARASVGEISDALRAAWGEYRPA